MTMTRPGRKTRCILAEDWVPDDGQGQALQTRQQSQADERNQQPSYRRTTVPADEANLIPTQVVSDTGTPLRPDRTTPPNV